MGSASPWTSAAGGAFGCSCNSDFSLMPGGGTLGIGNSAASKASGGGAFGGAAGGAAFAGGGCGMNAGQPGRVLG